MKLALFRAKHVAFSVATVVSVVMATGAPHKWR
jgi:hypothetical protein